MYLKKQDIETLESVLRILEKRKLHESEKETLLAFCDIIEDLKKQNEKAKESARANMRKYRSTPEGKEKNRINSKMQWERKKKEGKKP